MHTNRRVFLEVESLETRIALNADCSVLMSSPEMSEALLVEESDSETLLVEESDSETLLVEESDSETLLVEDSDSELALVQDTDTETNLAEDSDVIDPTEDPVDPSNDTTVSTVTTLGPYVDGMLQSITVTGLASSDVGYSTVQLQIGESVYEVDYVVEENAGEYTLIVSEGIDPAEVSVGDEVLVIVGTGGDDPTFEESDDLLPPPSLY